VNLIKKIKIYPQFEQLKKQVVELQESVGLKIISLQYQDINDTSWGNAEGYKYGPVEHKFTNLQPSLVGTDIDKLFQEIGMPMFRTRIMKIDPYSSYIAHMDPTPRIHIPIITNDNCRFFYPKEENTLGDFMAADGSVYWVDTRKYHTFINNSPYPRIHIVAVTKETL
jgi:hypothetical protein